MTHIPVLLNEALFYLSPQIGQDFIDATFGAGGHSLAILEKVSPSGRVLGIDADLQTYASANGKFGKTEGLMLAQGNFSELQQLASLHGFSKVSGVLFDLGLSSTLLDDPERGFSFQKNGPLDMRFDQQSSVTAAEVVQTASEARLEQIFRLYGEEKFSRRFAHAIVAARRLQHIVTTEALFNLIKETIPQSQRYLAGDSARRIFQALRIEVNRELENLREALPQAYNLLRPGGKLVVISFQSLEDRIVKQYFVSLARGCICPPEFPKCVCGKNPEIKILTKKPVMASAEEININSRARSAKLRAAEKL